MSEHSLEQALSALMDGEAGELELQRILRHLDEPGIRQTWQGLNQVRSAMHQKPLVHVDVSAGVRAALDGIEMDSPLRQPQETRPAGSSSASGWRNWQRFAVAASVTLAVLGGVRFYNQSQLQGPEPVLAQTAEPAVQMPAAPAYLRERPVVLASYSGQEKQEEQQDIARSSRWHREQLPLYLKQHAQQTGISGAEGALPYARTASMEGR